MNIAMIPARMGSQRLKKKNLQKLNDLPLIVHAIRKCISAGVFEEVWVNSEHPHFGEIARQEGVCFHKRPPELATSSATSEDFVYEFLKHHECDCLLQVHSIAPLLSTRQIVDFTNHINNSDCDVLLSCVNEQIECSLEGRPLNFDFSSKTNSQDLKPIQRITWSISGWRRSVYMDAYEAGRCATYAGKVSLYPIDRMAGHVIKTEEDLQIAEIYLQYRQSIKPSNNQY